MTKTQKLKIESLIPIIYNSMTHREFFYIIFYSWLFSISVSQVKSDVVLLIDLVNFTNPSGALYTGQCCDSYLNQQNCSALPPRCDVGIKICLDSSDYVLNASDANSCHYGSYLLNGLRDLNTFDFSQNPQATGPFIFNLNWNYRSLPRYLIKIFAIDDNSDRRAININEKDKLIDYYLIDFNKDQGIIPTNGLSNTIDWISYSNNIGQLSNNNFKTYLSLRVAMKCRTNFFTPTCNVRCVQQDSCEGGHYSCDENTGAKICYPGFYEPETDCVKRNFSIQLCEKTDQEYCSGKGFCYDSPFLPSDQTIPTCCCNKGFGGNNCSEIISCEVTTCQNGGECLIDPQTGYGYCRCKLGFRGKYCEDKIICPDNFYGDNCDTRCEAVDTCEIHQECDYFGRLKCKDGWGSFPECNTRLINPSIDPECPVISASDQNNYPPCLNGGSCWKGGCCCSPGFTGQRCESTVDQCQSSPCLNGGTCKSTINGFSCVCPPSFSGIFCQAYIDPCGNSTAQCSNAGVCVPFENYTDFSCSCYEGYTGKYCELQIDYCQSMPCINNATCVPIFKSYFCNCPPRFSGINCEQHMDLCESRPCVHGMCYNLINDYFCNCDPGWTNSKTCNDDIDECQITPSLCLNNSTCINELGSFRCLCPPGFTGQYCENRIDYCSSNSCIQSQTALCKNNQTHNTFTCICKPGFTGQLCESPMDYCASEPCIRDQYDRCINYQSTYSCVCKPGFSGHNCEINDNECLSSPCANNGICIDQINSFRCICPPGYTGQTCLTNTNPCIINETTNFTICGPFGTCYPQYFPNNTLSYYCQCIQGYEGQNCDKTKSICTMYSPCLNSGICIDTSPNNFTCICPQTYTGTFCENLINPCLKGVNLCNSGTCVNSPIGSANFTCLCPPQFSGQFCEILLDPCENNKCTPGQSICQPNTLSNGSRSYNCLCFSGFTGQYCEQLVDNCGQNPCQNNATCSNMIGYHTCQCLPNYYGNNCEYFYVCSLRPCNPTGTFQCIDLSPSSNGSSYKCSCRPGYTGQNCEINIDECESSPCRNNATCTDLVNSFFCQCPANYQGTLCETAFDFCRLNQCAHGSTCVPTENAYKCLCPVDKTGFYCDLQIDACESLPCQNGGSCVNLITDFSCNCAPGYTSKDCSQLIDQCAANQCQNNATCVNLVNSYYCNCPVGYTGNLCDKLVDFCNASPGQILCLNGGTCFNMADGFRCECTNGFTGSRCDSKIDLCNSTICKNNGLCRTRPDGSGVYCTCPSGFTGIFCEITVDNCQSMPCLNNATCINFPNSYACYCPFNYYGSRCENKLNFCQSSPCRNNGTCVDETEGFKCLCPSGFTGEICQIKVLACSSFPCLYGLCIDLLNGNFECKCEQGFTGTLCSERIDICETGIEGNSVCFNNGTCYNNYNQNSSLLFFCVCPPEYTGLRCETKKKACESFPCVRGNCTDLSNGQYNCLCPSGFTGLNCETDINECNDQVCFNNATCINTPGSFECRCLNGYSGRYCELTIDNCFSNPCQNGLCLNENGSFKCVCLNGFTGVFCEQIINFCESTPCQNQATCQSSGTNHFTCICQAGFTGVLCEKLIDPCESEPCQNNAYCINRSTYLNPSNFSCVCLAGYTGQFCEKRIDPCLSNTSCLNGGTCFETGLNQFKCICQSGYTGANCEIMDNCLSFPCLNGGTCFNSYPFGFQCFCPPKFTGPTCMETTSLCNPNPCLNAGACIESNNSFTCQCPAGYTGPRCELYSTCQPECINGRCVLGANGVYTCLCNPGFTGSYCQSDILECTSSPCKNGGICSEPFPNYYACSCPTGYSGINCEAVTNVCQSNPCLNAGTCVNHSPNNYFCICPVGFTGTNCELKFSACASNPCRNGAACIENGNQYTCQCVQGYQGLNCEVDIDECKSIPCQNGALCTTPDLNMYSCQCQPGYTGSNCQTWVNQCYSNPCVNGATCIQNLANEYHCICLPGYYGKNCENIINPCISQKCSKNFTNLNFNVYTESQLFNFDSYKQCIVNSWVSANPNVLNSSNVVLILEDSRPGLELNTFPYANRILSVNYSALLTDLIQLQINVPTIQDLSISCPQIVLGQVQLYDQFWEISVCGRLGQNLLKALESALRKIWSSKYLNTQLTIDIFRNLIRYETIQSQEVTKVSYLVYSNTEIFEKSKIDSTKIPSKAELVSALGEFNLNICQSSFSLSLCGTIKESEENDLLNDIRMSWQFAPGGLGTSTQIQVQKQGIDEFLSENSESKTVSNFRYSLIVNGLSLDEYNTFFNYESIKNYFFQKFSNNYQECSADYPLTEAFRVVTSNRLCDSNIRRIEDLVANWYKVSFNQPGVKIDVKIVKIGIEEQIDDLSNLYYDIPIFILTDSLFVKPTESLQQRLRDFFKTIAVTLSSEKKFSIIDPNETNLYRVAKLFQFYLNARVNRKNESVLIDLIKESFNKFNYEKFSQVSIKLQEDVILKKGQNIHKAVRLLALITNQTNNLYDSRRTETDNIIHDLALSVNSKNTILTDSGEKLLINNTNELSGYNVIKYTDLYILFVQNEYNDLVPSVLTKISSFLSDQWEQLQTSIFIINNEIFFDDGHVLLGIRYMVEDNFPDCTDLKCLDSFKTNFGQNFGSDSCKTSYYPCSLHKNPTRDFYTLELIGNVNLMEQKFNSWINESLHNSWKKEYPQLNSIQITKFNAKQDLRIGSLGTQTTRIFYTVALDSQSFSKNIYPSPSSDRIAEEFVKLGSDLRIYPEKNSISKNALASIYARVYPLNPSLRLEIEKKITSFYTNSDLVNLTSNILYWELYSGDFKQDLTRLYFTLDEKNSMKYECELNVNRLYLKNISEKLTSTLEEYPIKSRYLDLEYEKFTYNFTDLTQRIKKVWLNKNEKQIGDKNVNVRIHNFSFWTSIFKKIIIRFTYFLTINGVNVDNNHDYTEPTLEDFSIQIMNVSFYFPNKLYKFFVYGNPNFVNQEALIRSIDLAWQRKNSNKRIFSIENAESTQVLPTTLFFDFNNAYANLSKIGYKILFNKFADQNDLFDLEPNELLKSNLEQASYKLCSLPECQPVQFFNFFSTKNYTKSEIDELAENVKKSWILQNPLDAQTDLEQLIINNIYRIVPYKNNNSEIIYGIFYPMGLKKNPQNLDISDFFDPSDENYNATIGTVYPRGDYEQYIPTNSSALIVEPVQGLEWWMILIIILACILFILLLLLCLFAFCIRRRQKEKKMKHYQTFQTNSSNQNYNTARNLDTLNFDPGVSVRTTHMGNVIPQGEEIIENRHSFRNLTENNLYETSNYEISNNLNRPRSISASENFNTFGHMNNLNSTPNATIAKKNVIVNKYYEDIHHHHTSVRRSMSDLNEMVDVISIDVKYPYEFETKIN